MTGSAEGATLSLASPEDRPRKGALRRLVMFVAGLFLLGLAGLLWLSRFVLVSPPPLPRKPGTAPTRPPEPSRSPALDLLSRLGEVEELILRTRGLQSPGFRRASRDAGAPDPGTDHETMARNAADLVLAVRELVRHRPPHRVPEAVDLRIARCLGYVTWLCRRLADEPSLPTEIRDQLGSKSQFLAPIDCVDAEHATRSYLCLRWIGARQLFKRGSGLVDPWTFQIERMKQSDLEDIVTFTERALLARMARRFQENAPDFTRTVIGGAPPRPHPIAQPLADLASWRARQRVDPVWEVAFADEFLMLCEPIIESDEDPSTRVRVGRAASGCWSRLRRLPVDPHLRRVFHARRDRMVAQLEPLIESSSDRSAFRFPDLPEPGSP